MKNKLCGFASQLNRLKDAASVKTDTALAHLLGITQGGFSNAKARNKIPHKWFVFVATNYGVNLEWLMSGTGERYAGQPANENNASLMSRIAELERENETLKIENDQLRQEIKEAQQEAVSAYRQALSTVHEFALKGGVGTLGAPVSAPSAPSINQHNEE